MTALPVEAAAIRLLIGDARQTRMPGDPNQYDEGWLPSADPGRPHRVVSTVLPRDGTRTAAAACADLLRTFPTVRCVLMCGVAGGIPAPPNWPGRHILLGDIVVATAGVVDYGHVWRTNGADKVRRSVDGLSMDLLRAAVELQTRERLDDRPWQARLADPPPPFRRPDAITGSAARVPQVHYGAVGSGDQLVQDAAWRDELAARHGILAVEMEASGVSAGATLRGAHWFMVRGIADHCEAGRTAAWQPYAAFAAASYACSLLAVAPRLAPAISVTVAANGNAAPEEMPLDGLRSMLDVLQTVPPLRDDLPRQEFLALLPAGIRATIPYHSNPRLHLMAVIRACERFPGGRDAFLSALRATLPDSADLTRCEQVVAVNWRPGGDH